MKRNRQKTALKKLEEPHTGELLTVANPGFPTRPWQARAEMKGPHGLYTPRHLHIYTEDERDPQHYPRAEKDMLGEFTHFCWACGRPTKVNGVTGKGHSGVGKPCPACGFRRKRAVTEEQKKAGRENFARATAARAAKGLKPGFATPEYIAKREATRKRSRMGVNEIMVERAMEHAEDIIRPYIEGLQQRPREDWAPSTKLEFYMNQTQIAEKLLNRVEGMPVARTRHVDENDEDVLRDDELSPGVLAQLVASIVSETKLEDMLIEDAEFEEIVPAELEEGTE
jgi:hypothetical protein